MSFGRAMRDFALPPPPSVPLPSSPPLQNKDHHCTGKTHSFQKTTAIRVSRPFVQIQIEPEPLGLQKWFLHFWNLCSKTVNLSTFGGLYDH